MQWEGRKGCVLHNKVTSRHLPRRAVGDLFAPVAAAAGCPSQTLVLNKPWPTLPAWMHQRTYLTGEFLMQVRAAPLIRHVQATALLHAWQLSLASVEHAALATLHRGSHATRRSLKCPALHLLPFAERFRHTRRVCVQSAETQREPEPLPREAFQLEVPEAERERPLWSLPLEHEVTTARLAKQHA